MKKELVPVITAEQVAQGDAAATAQGKGTITALSRARSGEEEPKPKKASKKR